MVSCLLALVSVGLEVNQRVECSSDRCLLFYVCCMYIVVSCYNENMVSLYPHHTLLLVISLFISGLETMRILISFFNACGCKEEEDIEQAL